MINGLKEQLIHQQCTYKERVGCILNPLSRVYLTGGYLDGLKVFRILH